MGFSDIIDRLRAAQQANTAEAGTVDLRLNTAGLPTWASPYFLDPVTKEPVYWDALKESHPQWAGLIDSRKTLGVSGGAVIEKYVVEKYGPEYSSGDDYRFLASGELVKNDPFPYALAAAAAIPIAAPFLLPAVGSLSGVAAVTGGAATTIQRATAQPPEPPPIVVTQQQAAAAAMQQQAAGGILGALNDPTTQTILIAIVVVIIIARS